MIFISTICVVAQKNDNITELQDEIETLKEQNETLEEKVQSNKNSSTTNLNTIKVETVQTSNKIEDTVYVTDTGTKYHKSGCQHLRKSKNAISKEKAIRQGYTACSRCNP